MQRDEALRRLRAHEPEFRRLGVRSLYLFGSTARGVAGAASDVDLFFDYPKGSFGLFDLMEVQEQAARILGTTADVTTRDGLHEALRPRIEANAIRVF